MAQVTVGRRVIGADITGASPGYEHLSSNAESERAPSTTSTTSTTSWTSTTSTTSRTWKGSNLDVVPTRKASRIQAMVTRKKGSLGGGLRALLTAKRMAHPKTHKHRSMVRAFHLRALPDMQTTARHPHKTSTFLGNAFVNGSWVFRPMGRLVQYWRVLIIAVCWFYAWVLPFLLSFSLSPGSILATGGDSAVILGLRVNIGYQHYVGYALDLIFMLDVLVTLNVAVPKKYLTRELENEHDDDDDFLVADRKAIWARYRKRPARLSVVITQ